MDPFSALGLAANVIQFVDFAWKLLTETREIGKSIDGYSEENRSLATIISDITLSDIAITTIITDDPSLQQIISQCQTVSAKLMDVLEKLRVGQSQFGWSNFKTALKGVWNKREIESLFETVLRLRMRVLEHLSTITFTRVSGLVDKVGEMDETWKRLEMQRRMTYDAVDRQKSLDMTVQNAKNDRRMREAVARRDQVGFDFFAVYEVANVQSTINASDDIMSRDLIRVIKRLQEEAPKFEEDLEFLTSLHFQGIKARHRGIKDRHSHTFDWILRDNPVKLEYLGPSLEIQPAIKGPEVSRPVTPQPENDPGIFSRWLQMEGGIFWIHGKPGCGKSTLMKFICSSDKTSEKLKRWAAPKKLVTAHYFFWRSGSQLQRTQPGLLRSLIFEMIKQCPDLLPSAKATLPQTEVFDSEDEAWTQDQLLKTYKAIVSQDLTTRFCFFIDGLDEYIDGDRKPQDLVRTIRQLDFSPDVKLCISSRPYPVFDEEFGQDKERIIKVEEHTRGDIRLYVEEKFRTTGNFTNLQKRDPAYSKFVDEVADRAQGVFLWVVLVVASLENEITNSDSVLRLRTRLNSYPPDLDDFFLAMLKSVEKEYRKQAMRTFEMVTTALHPLNAMIFWYLYAIDDDPRETDMWKRVRRTYGSTVDGIQRDLRRIIQARSQGLLELVEDGDHSEAFFRFKVDFIHRTVRDFLRNSDAVREQFETELKNEQRSTWMVACHAILTVFQAAPCSGFREEEFLKQLVMDIYYYANLAVSDRRSVPRQTAARWVGQGEHLFKQKLHSFTNRQPPHRFFLCLDAQYGFHEKLRDRIQKHGKVLKLDRDGGRPVLEYALIPIPGTGPVHYSEAAVKYLLRAGAQPWRRDMNKSVGESFIVYLSDGQIETDPSIRQTLVSIVKLLLDYDGDSCLNHIIETDTGPKTVEAVLRDVFSTEELDQISLLKRKSWYKSLLSWPT
ncbi:hypothetical protein FQN55_000975 [Onygenales sp. PD_40]|nr:hypothetical protein FQN55_000975 [Onygenales sp. PD_40]